MAKTPKPPVVIERNQTVVIRIDRAGLVVTAMGKAMQQGKLGENIKVRNVDSQRVILAKVNEDGTVEPVLLKRGKTMNQIIKHRINLFVF